MKKETWKTIIQVIVSILTAALTALGTTSCMGHGPIIALKRSRCQFSFIPVCISYTHVCLVSKDLYFENFGKNGSADFPGWQV